MSDENLRAELHGMLVFMASLSHGMEEVLGRGAASIAFRAGRTIGMKAEVGQLQPDLEKAVPMVEAEMRKRGIVWPAELWKPASEKSFFYQKGDKLASKLVFRNCMMRCALFRYGHPQEHSLCHMNHGFFCGFLQKITGKPVELEIIHAGENACLEELLIGQ